MRLAIPDVVQMLPEVIMLLAPPQVKHDYKLHDYKARLQKSVSALPHTEIRFAALARSSLGEARPQNPHAKAKSNLL